MNKTPTTLIIMDGFGLAPAADDNAVTLAKTPVLDGLFRDYAHTTLSASGLDVGLPAGQMGNSEVGHTNIGGGRVVFQDLPRISRAIEDGTFFANEGYNKAVEDCLQKQEPLTVDLDQMQSRVFLRLVNYERNQETLANCPYIPFHDMAITFRYLVKMDEAGIASALIDYDSMEKSACTVEELYCMAKENTIRLFPPFLMRLDEFLRTRFPQEHVYPEEPEVYILSNRQFIYGATMLLYKDVVASFAEQMGKSVYIVPSSVNELLLCLTDAKKEKEMLENTLREVNEFVVPDTEFLSDAVYFYDKELGNIVG